MKNHISHLIFQSRFYSNGIHLKRYLKTCCLFLAVVSCSNFIEVDAPKNVLISETVFENASTVESAMANIYYRMREEGMATYGLSAHLGLYADELDYYYADFNLLSLYTNSLLPENSIVLEYWKNTYSIIYATNDVIEGVTKSTTLTVEEKEKFKGQALFIRGYLHSLLVSLYGDIPYIKTTDYIENNTTARRPKNDVYQSILADVVLAQSLMTTDDPTGMSVIPNRSAATALLANIYLKLENWELAEHNATELIEAFQLEPDLNKVFIKDSKETIWQFKDDLITSRNTFQANQFIIKAIPGQTYSLTNTVLDAFETDDLRRSSWVGSFTSNDGLTTLYYPYKYKASLSDKESLEFSIVFRLAEQYLIRAEARAHLGNVSGAKNDLDVIRNRAGLEATTAATKVDILDAILQERFVELFSEQGHRWFDLKRTGRDGDILGAYKPNYQPTDALWPIPETELEINPKLRPQNSGY
ncbi:RagB/SusD family nutrient uptake outer membrane protein [Gelidibacter salicanalis]|uniref:RagB/SusD family nutrient uptake outer membrane protein n=1 Tax=Gelidibacter salicanalis TaxID=291193 RepID=A0A934NID5_9FLAO|nr:RagB/SusD family nutrient uptake outer membrane protein [Gelidibacter salicanalis]MBJ7880978.1 RagB/SusD family nutrient uptake outer membrane protein [Gelidibacter salicanalis]